MSNESPKSSIRSSDFLSGGNVQNQYQKLMSLSNQMTRLTHLEPSRPLCKERDFLQCLKLTKALLSIEQTEAESSLRLDSPNFSELSRAHTVDTIEEADLPKKLKELESFQFHGTTKDIIYQKPLRLGWHLSTTDAILEMTVTESDLEDDLGWILNRFIKHFNIGVLKLENNRFFGSQATCAKFMEQLIELSLSHLSLDRTNLHGCNLGSLFRLQVVQMSLRFCNIEDEDVHTFWEPLAKNESLRFLNLNFNRIKNLGCRDLALSLRLNRALKCLSLVNNAIENAGCLNILAVLQTFRLDNKEVFDLRKAKLDSYLSLLDDTGNPIEKPKPLVSPPVMKSRVTFSMDNIPAESLKKSSVLKRSAAKIPSRSKISIDRSRALIAPDESVPEPVAAPSTVPSTSTAHTGRSSMIGGGRSGMMKSETVESVPEGEQQNTSVLAIEVKPPSLPKLGTVTWTLKDGAFFCEGNFHLSHLYLSHNKLTLSIIPAVVNVLRHQQDTAMPPQSGLTLLTLQNDVIYHDIVALKRLIDSSGG